MIAAQQPMCGCGTFAVGRCHSCGKWVCGEHSAMFENDRLCLDHHHQALAPQRKRKAEAREKQEAAWRRQREENEENWKRQKAEQEQQRQRRNRADEVQTVVLIVIPVIAYLYFDGEGMSKALNLVLSGAIAGFLAIAGTAAYTRHSYEGELEEHFAWDATSFWLGVLGIPLGAAAGGVLALVI